MAYMPAGSQVITINLMMNFCIKFKLFSRIMMRKGIQ